MKKLLTIFLGFTAPAWADLKLETGEASVKVLDDGKLVTEYRTDWKVPYLYPLMSSSGANITRHWPTKPGVEGEETDHPHHRSIWMGHGLVNGADFWSFKDTKNATIVHKGFDTGSAVNSGDKVTFTANLEWQAEGKKLIDEKRTISVSKPSKTTLELDFTCALVAAEDITFGDTKEGGLIALRVAETMNEKQKEERPGGVITNAYGATGMKDCWGKPAPWCDYSGPAGGITVGITIMDFPKNPFYPIRYHVRDYGLFGANPFGLSNFIAKGEDGSRILKQGESWRLRFRVYVHAGDVKSGHVKEAYGNFADAPLIKLQ